jgi:hypothetical protein
MSAGLDEFIRRHLDSGGQTKSGQEIPLNQADKAMGAAGIEPPCLPSCPLSSGEPCDRADPQLGGCLTGRARNHSDTCSC